MKTHQVQQKTERRISAALRLVFVAALLLGQIALAFFLSTELRQRAAIIYTVLELAAFGYAVRIYNRTDGASYKFGWIFLVLTVPVVGLILYFLWNGDRQQKRLDLKKLPMPEEPEAQQAAHRIQMEKLRRKFPQWERLSVYLSRQGYLLYGDTETTYLPTGEAFLQDMLEKLEQAEHFIFLEFFIIAQGQVWDRMEEIFRRKAAEGVEVKLIFDDFGSMMRLPAEQIEALRESGVEVQIFNPVHHYVNRLYFNYRDHRKIVCIDGSTAYTGGANVADEYANLTVRFGYWKDCGIRLDGPGAWGLTREFLHMWQRNGGQLMQERDYYRPHDHREAAGFCQPFVDGPDNNPISTAEDVFLHLINNARRSVHITTPYLAIDEPMRQALCSAGDSGVDVRLLLPGIPDHKFAYLAAQSHYGELLVHHVKIYIYEPGLLHGKTVLSDGEAAFVGSVNMDYRSFQLHFECGTVLYGVPAIEGLAEDIQRITDRSRRVTYQEWKSRPWYRKLLSTLLRLFEMWM